MVTHMGKGLVFRCSATPPPQGAESQLSPILGLLSIYVSEKRVSWTQPRLPPQDSRVQRSPIYGILLYFSLHHLTQNDLIQHGNTYGEGRVLGGLPRYCACIYASRGLSAIAEILVHLIVTGE